MISDGELIKATLRGDTSAFGRIVERYCNMVVGLALSRMGDLGEAEDVAQESFLKAYLNLHRLQDPSRFAGWLSKIAVQQCSGTVRRSARCRSALGCNRTPLEEVEGKAAGKTKRGLTESQIHFIRESVGRLPEKFQRLIIMRFVTGLSAVEIARQLGKRPGTVRVWLHRAYKVLRKDLGPVLEEVKS
jgi:RNA polymerase sigma-70 factor (ECF subfamily)